MAEARAQTAGGSGGSGKSGPDEVPPAFRRAAAALDAARPPAGVRLSPLPAPKRLAPFAHALEATLEEGDEELAGGRFVLLHDPAGQESWQGTFRVVTLVRTELEAEMAADPLLPEVTWTWLTGALEAQGAGYGQPSGTVTRSGSYFFGGLSERAPQSELEIRASWTPGADEGPERLAEGRERTADEPDVAAHLAAWCELLRQCAGLPPESGDGASVVPLPQRRGPHPL